METNNLGKQSSTLLWKGSTLQLLGVIIFPLAILVLTFALGGAFAHQQAMWRMVGERDTLAVSAAASTLNTELIGASLKISSGLGNGTNLTIQLPLKPE